MKVKLFILTALLSLTLSGCSNQETKELNSDVSNTTDIQENNVVESENENNKEESFVIYTLDVDDTDKVIEFETVNLKEDTDISYKMSQLCTILRKDYFNGEVEIEFVDIDENNIATINLVNEEAWSPKFQGSTGGMVTQSTILETLLQKNYNGAWIDGINITIDGKPGDDYTFEHAPFEGTFYRNK
jgi:hypothetical protein